jgi:hypothetical protein
MGGTFGTNWKAEKCIQDSIPNKYREEKTWEIYALPESNINTDHEAWEWYRFSLLRVGCCKHCMKSLIP